MKSRMRKITIKLQKFYISRKQEDCFSWIVSKLIMWASCVCLVLTVLMCLVLSCMAAVICVICTCSVLCFCPLCLPLWPLVGLGGQFMIWLWCYNTIGLQWCCSSSLTLLAPPTGPVLPTLLLLCLLGSAHPPLVAIWQCVGDPWGDGDHGSPFQNGQSPCVLHHLPVSLPVNHACLGVTVNIWDLDGD